MGYALRRVGAAVLAMLVTSSVFSMLICVSPDTVDPLGKELQDTKTPLVPVLIDSLPFTEPLDTNLTVPEYPMIARPLLLPGGASNATLADLNGDGQDDLVVVVSEPKNISIFYREASGSFPSAASWGLSLSRIPLAIVAADLFNSGNTQLVVLERKLNALDTDHVEVFNRTITGTYVSIIDRDVPFANAVDIQVGDLNGDPFPDLAVACTGTSPSSTAGRLEISYGPTFSAWDVLLYGGHGSNSLALGDFNNDTKEDIALANYYDSQIAVFYQPFNDLMTPNLTLSAAGNPVDVCAGNLNPDGQTDLAVVTRTPSTLGFYYQSLETLQVTPDPTDSRTIASVPGAVYSDDLDDDGQDDILIISPEARVAFGYVQQPASPIWPEEPAFIFPTGEYPRGAIIGEMDADAGTDVIITTARADLTGSSLALYSNRAPVGAIFSNGNDTAWLNKTLSPTAITVGDIDGDGVEDLIVASATDNCTTYYLGFNGEQGVTHLGLTPSMISTADANGDGCADVVVSFVSADEVSVLFGSTDLSVTAAPLDALSVTCSGNVTDYAVGDLNDDSRIDIAVTTEAGKIDIFYNTGSTADPYDVAFQIDGEISGEVQAITVGDFNSDGLDDIAYTRENFTIAVTYQRLTVPTIPGVADLTLYRQVGGQFSELWSGDLTGDERDDIAAMKPLDPRVYLFDRKDFNTTGMPYDTIDFPELPEFATFADATDDASLDLLVIFDDADLLFLYRQDAGMIPSSPSMTFVTGAVPTFAAVGDGSRDGRGDLLVLDSGSYTVSVWEQFNTPPVAEAGGPYVGTEGEPVVLSGTVETGLSELAHMQYRWFFGDGEVSSWSNSPVAAHEYAESELPYVATFEAKDPAGLNDTDTAEVSVSDGAPVVDFTWSPEIPDEGDLVTFVDASDSFDAIVLYNWTLDGVLVASGSLDMISERLQNGSHAVGLEVMDSDGSVSSTVKTVTVGRTAPEIEIVGPSTVYEWSAVAFSVDVDEWHRIADTIVNYEWNFSYSGAPFITDLSTGTTNETVHMFETSELQETLIVAVRATDNDGDSSIAVIAVTVIDVPMVELSIEPDLDFFYEFDTVNLSASVDAYYGPTLYEWDFEAVPGYFAVDLTSVEGEISHVYEVADNYLLRLRVTLSNGSLVYASAYIVVEDIVPTGDFDSNVVVRRSTSDTSVLTFDASAVYASYHDILTTLWDFGDGTTQQVDGLSAAALTHKYLPVIDYTVSVTFTDDDGNSLRLEKLLKMIAPTIELVSPTDDPVIRSDTVIRFEIGDDDPPLASVMYSLDGGAFVNFTVQWRIPAAGWYDGEHTLTIRAIDQDGNVAMLSGLMFRVDNSPPSLSIAFSDPSVFGGDKMNITVDIVDPNIGPGGVTLFVRFPGDDSFSQFVMSYGGGTTYYMVLHVPVRSGTLEFYVNATDLAGNYYQSSVTSVEVKLHFIDVAWPYMLAFALLAVLGTAFYFVNETRHAVDETFVIYNDGRLISHSTRRLKPGMDDQVLSGMFVAIQDFVKDSFKDVTSFTLRKLEFGEKSVLIEKGDHLFLAVILHGKATRKIGARMERVVDDIEELYSEHLTGWDGDLDRVRGVGDIVNKLYSKAPMLPRALSGLKIR